MSISDDNISEADLMAFIDGQLSEADHARIEAYLEQNPAKAAEVAEWLQQNEAIEALYGHVAKEPVPPQLNVHTIERNIARNRYSSWQMAAAAVVLLTIGTGLGWFSRSSTELSFTQTGQLITAAVSAHELYAGQKTHPVEVSASDATHLTTWLSASIGRKLVTPDLTDQGYSLVGGRLLPAPEQSAAQLMYEDGSGARITLYLTARTDQLQGDDSFIVADNGTAALYWAADAITCTIVGDLSRDDMSTLASTVFKSLIAAGYSRA